MPKLRKLVKNQVEYPMVTIKSLYFKYNKHNIMTLLQYNARKIRVIFSTVIIYFVFLILKSNCDIVSWNIFI